MDKIMLEYVQQLLDKINVLTIAVFLWILGYRMQWRNRKQSDCKTSTKSIPGPFSLPVVGTRWIFYFGGYQLNKIHEYYKDIYERYGPIVKEEALFNIRIINIFERRDIEKVLRTPCKYPIRPPTEAVAYYRRSRPDRYASTGLVNEQGETWHFLRTSLTSDLVSPRTISTFAYDVQEIGEDWCKLLLSQKDIAGDIKSLDRLAGQLGLETICALVLGRRMGFLSTEVESAKSKEFANAIHENFVACRDTYFGLPFWKFFPTSAYKQLTQSEETIYKIALDLIHSADDSTKESAVFQSVLKANVDEREKTAAIIDFIASGIHTLKNSFLFLLYEVAKHPDVQDKILEDPAYLKACVNETFRLLPTAGTLARIIDQDIELSGHKIKAGNVVLCHNGIACRDERNFKLANEFRPERWLNEEKTSTVSAATFLVTPFGAGRRICPGKRFIELVLPIFLEHTIRYFKVKTDQEMELQFEFLLSPKEPISMSFKTRF